MICTSCRLRLLTRLRFPQSSHSSSLRYASTIPDTPNAGPIQAPSSIAVEGANPTHSSRTSGISQPLSEAHTPSTSTAKAAAAKEPKKPAKVKSSVPGGEVLKGLGYTKAQPQILAKEDHEYPEWLWTLLDDSKMATGDTKVDLSAMTKKQRARYERQQEKLLKDLPVNIPPHEQSKDLTGPGDDAVTSLQRRHEITKSARAARRKSIRESNFLKSM
ncbi:hypothetical protein A1O1_05670 [Capronia coronata CBS 617.96]|uniref:Large ribosomal subunit protein mL54 n=1 Tax=Capronia coronata CBS 617.96 TaxID=1182541 RepID=W9Y876_9EURO|nr:uncharacterized protein A1O1_05670 [Capronia coronata CBS 617.96]EXJ88738.1 hypothetical protein A1O1_05670 [Capronia coronata CBS 617.96]